MTVLKWICAQVRVLTVLLTCFVALFAAPRSWGGGVGYVAAAAAAAHARAPSPIAFRMFTSAGLLLIMAAMVSTLDRPCSLAIVRRARW